MSNIIEHLIPVVEKEFPDAEISTNSLNFIKVSQLTNDDEERPSKRYQPILISLHSDFETSELAKRPTAEIVESFTSFIKSEHSKLKLRTTDNRNQPHEADEWVFPVEC